MINQYIQSLDKRFRTDISTEHTYRGDLQSLLELLCPGILVTNEPSRVACGAPDYILTRKNIPIGYIEAKDIGNTDLEGKNANKEQFDRYKGSLANLITTDYLDFRLFRQGEFVTSINIGSIQDGRIIPDPTKFDEFTLFINEFISFESQSIKSPKKLAEMMADKARMLANIIEQALIADENEIDQANELANNTLQEQLQAFKQVLIHDIKPNEFADIYAQTIAYGMFAARLYDTTLEDFSRQEAAELIPKSNPFLRKLFQYIAGYDLDDRIKWIVDALADIFRATDVASLLKNFGATTQQNDPMIHFYETFLGAYNPRLKKSRGVWYTPEPVVNFIVRAVDDILKEEFGLSDGLANTSKTKIFINTQTSDKRSKTGFKQVEKEVHKVQILDPAAGTGTFLAEVIRQIYKKFENQQGIWSNYVENHLIPRLNGFELLMASYAMAHLKLELLLSETGYKPSREQRLKVFLTNSLEEHHPDTGTLFANWLSTEANEANHIKRDTPVMCVIGNPPYSGISSNNGEWITDLINNYKFINGVHFRERKHWLNDDYVKFLRYGQYLIEKNGSGILAFINPHGFLDNPTFRGMRWHLLKTFDKIFTIDLHGNTKKKETAPDGSADTNVFDIQQGVSINIFIKTGKKKSDELGRVLHTELFGQREIKYDFLNISSLEAIDFTEIRPAEPYYFFIPKDTESLSEYEKGFLTSELFLSQSMGITSARDSFVIDFTKDELLTRIIDFTNLDIDDNIIREKYFGSKKAGKYLKGDTRGWKLTDARISIAKNNHNEYLLPISYRPFDERFIYYFPSMVDWGREEVMEHLVNENIAFCFVKVGRNADSHNYFVSNHITDKSICSSLDNSNVFPLYLYSETGNQQSIDENTERTPNLDKRIIYELAKKLKLSYTSEKKDIDKTFAPIDILDYIYAILFCPTYRERYKEFLKIDFPKVPYPKDKETFWQLVKLGGELRQLHLMESPLLTKHQTRYPHDGDNRVSRKITMKDWELYDTDAQIGRVWINNQQYFENIPLVAWEFYIGGYQPAKKWLKDRNGRQLGYEDIVHYQNIITALTETDRIMKEIDEVDFF
jgi:predicted helicase